MEKDYKKAKKAVEASLCMVAAPGDAVTEVATDKAVYRLRTPAALAAKGGDAVAWAAKAAGAVPSGESVESARVLGLAD